MDENYKNCFAYIFKVLKCINMNLYVECCWKYYKCYSKYILLLSLYKEKSLNICSCIKLSGKYSLCKKCAYF